VENYFKYFSEIEEHFQRRRGTTLLLSTLDWALIESWKESGVPLAAVLRGIDEAFDKYDARPSKSRKVNSLAYCSQAVLAAAEEAQEAALGVKQPKSETGITPQEIRNYLALNAEKLERARNQLPEGLRQLAASGAKRLREMAAGIPVEKLPAAGLEDMERTLIVLEEKLVAGLVAAAPERQMIEIRKEADHEMAPYRRQMLAAQIEQLHRQYVHRRLLEQHGLPRLSLFYMR
jgi:hypothetical protein